MNEWQELDLRGRTALVTGGSRGIGRAIVAALLARGMTVLATGRGAEGLARLQADFPKAPLHTAVCEQRDPAAVAALLASARQCFPALFLLVNNAALGLYGPAAEVSQETWDTVLETDARGPFLLAQGAFRWMRETGGGRIINLGSVVAHKGYENQVAYAAAKHALLAITKVMAREGQAHGIRVSIINPGGVATDMVRQARPDLDPAGLIQPADIARAVLYLASEPASVCTDELNLRRAGSQPFA